MKTILSMLISIILVVLGCFGAVLYYKEGFTWLTLLGYFLLMLITVPAFLTYLRIFDNLLNRKK